MLRHSHPGMMQSLSWSYAKSTLPAVPVTLSWQTLVEDDVTDEYVGFFCCWAEFFQKGDMATKKICLTKKYVEVNCWDPTNQIALFFGGRGGGFVHHPPNCSLQRKTAHASSERISKWPPNHQGETLPHKRWEKITQTWGYSPQKLTVRPWEKAIPQRKVVPTCSNHWLSGASC